MNGKQKINTLSPEEMEYNANRLIKYIELYLVEFYGEPILEQLVESPTFKEFTTIPATYKNDYAGSFFGGLCLHALEMTNIFCSLNELTKAGLSDKSMALISLFSSIGKTGEVNKDGSIVKYYQGINTSTGNFYINNDGLVKMPIQLRSIRILNHFNIKMDEAEYAAFMSLSSPDNLSDYGEETLSTYAKIAYRLAFEELKKVGRK